MGWNSRKHLWGWESKRGKDGEGRKARKKENAGWESGMEGRREGGKEDLFQDSSHIA